jgi:ABC-2 type transport system ATP-binding protein
VIANPEPSTAEQAPAVALALRGLHHSYGSVHAIQGLDLTVHRGEVYGFLGRNGAGKTTTIRALMGILRPDSGIIEMLGNRVTRVRPDHKRNIGYVAQEQHFYPWMTCREIGRFVGGFYPSWDAIEFERLLDVFELPARRRISALSHGMRVKLALALATAPRPPLLILDEPTSGLDPVARREFSDLVDVQARSAHQTVFFSTHLVEEVERLADRICILDRGRALYEGSLDDLRSSVRLLDASALERLPPGFRVLQRVGQNDLVVHAEPVQWAEAPLAERARALPLNEIFIALVTGGRNS